MALWDDDRGQAIQIGAVLLFAVLVIAFSLYQAFVVPNQNERVEMDHLQVVEGEMQDLRNAIVSVPRTGDGRSARLTLGTSYPARAIALNPPPPTGRLRTVGTDDEQINFTLAHVRALDDETADYWDGTTNRNRSSGALVYDPDYNVLQDAPTIVYDTTALSSQFRDANLWASGQTLVDGRTLTLVALDGSLDRSSSRSLAVDVEAISASTTDVAITNETGENVTVAFSSSRSASDWRSLLVEEGQWYNQSGGHVVSVDGTSISERFDRITMELERNETYELRMAKAGVGTGATTSSEAYITAIGSKTVASNETFTAEVRDEFNNPVSGVNVSNRHVRNKSGCDIEPKRTDERGRVSYECQGPAKVALEIGDSDYESVTYQVGTFLADTQPPSIDGPSSFERSESTRVTDTFPFGGQEETSISQFVFQSTVSDKSGTGLDYISYRLLDNTGNIVTAGTDHLNIEEDTDVSWYSPWFENPDLNGNPEDYELVVTVTDNTGGSTTATIPVGGAIATGPNFQTTIDSTNSPVEEGETLTVDATIENTGDSSGQQAIELEVGSVRDTIQLSLDSGQSQQVTLQWQTAGGDAGDYVAIVRSANTSDQTNVTVQQPQTLSIDQFTVQSQNRPNQARFDVQFDASAGTAGITDAELQLIEADTQNVVDSWSGTYGNQQTVNETLTGELKDNQGAGNQYEIRLTVTDANTNQVQATRTATG